MKKILLLFIPLMLSLASKAQLFESGSDTVTVNQTAGDELITAAGSIGAGMGLAISGACVIAIVPSYLDTEAKTHDNSFKTVMFCGTALALTGVALTISGVIHMGKAGKKLNLLIKNNQAGIYLKF